MLLKKLKSVSLTDDKSSIEKKIKKISKNKVHKMKDMEEMNYLSLEDHDSLSSGSITPKKKSKKKRQVT